MSPPAALACLVDDPPHDTARVSHDADAAWSTGEFLSQVAALALGRSRAEPDGTGRTFTRTAPASAPSDSCVSSQVRRPSMSSHVVSSLEQLVNRPACTTWRLRLLPIAVCVLPVVLSGINVRDGDRG